MAVLIDNDTKLVVSGITGREGTFHALNNKRYGTNVVAGVTPGKAGQDVEGIPVFNTFRDAVAQTGANVAMVFVPPRFAADSILEAADAGIPLVICITEGIPAHDELRVYTHLQRTGTRLVGPNCPGILSPGKANVGIIPASFFKEGNVGVVSRSGTLTYQIGNTLAQAGFGNSSIVGIGGDPVPGSSFIDVIELFEADDQTELIVLSGEIGGDAEERAADYIAEHVTKPVVAYIAGFTAPPGKTMGHAGAIVSGSKGTAAAKAEALEAKGVRVGRTPTQVAEIAVEILGGYSVSSVGVALRTRVRSRTVESDVTTTLSELERKLKELERELETVGRGGELDNDPAQGGWTPVPDPPQEQRSAGAGSDSATPLTASWHGTAGADAPPPPAFNGVPPVPVTPPAAPWPQAATPPAYAPPPPPAAGLHRQLDELLAFRDRLVRTTDDLVSELSRVLTELGVGAAPDPADTLLSGDVTIDAAPFNDLATLAAFEQALQRVAGVAGVYVRALDAGRATIDVRLSGRVALAAALRATAPLPFAVTDVRDGRLTLAIN